VATHCADVARETLIDFLTHDATQGLTSNAVQCTFEDDDGRIWLGGCRGLFCCEGERVVLVGRNGPWP